MAPFVLDCVEIIRNADRLFRISFDNRHWRVKGRRVPGITPASRFNYRPQTKLWEGNAFLHLSVFLSMGGGGERSAFWGGGVCMEGSLHGGGDPPQKADSTLPTDTVNRWAVRILLECKLVISCSWNFR